MKVPVGAKAGDFWRALPEDQMQTVTKKQCALLATHMADGKTYREASVAMGMSLGWGHKKGWLLIQTPYYKRCLEAELDKIRANVSYMDREYLLKELDKIIKENRTNESIRVRAIAQASKILGFDKQVIEHSGKFEELVVRFVPIEGESKPIEVKAITPTFSAIKEVSNGESEHTAIPSSTEASPKPES